MNVKPGDMARVVGSGQGNGTIVTVVRKASELELSKLAIRGYDIERQVWVVRVLNGTPAWSLSPTACGRVTRYAMPGQECMIADPYLRRIDPKADDTTDETADTREVATT